MFLSEAARVDPRLSAWRRDGINIPLDVGPRGPEGDHIGSIPVSGKPQSLGYLISLWTGDEDCGARLRVVYGVGDIGIAIPNSLSLELLGTMAETDIQGLIRIAVSTFAAHAADVTTEAFLDMMLDEDEAIVCPSGGLAFYTSDDPGAPLPGCSISRIENGYLTTQVDLSNARPDELDVGLATSMHHMLKPWRDSLKSAPPRIGM